jgi:gliding motility-associated-like protein
MKHAYTHFRIRFFSVLIALLFLNTGYASKYSPNFVNTIDLGDTIFIDVENAIVGAGYIDYPVYINSDDPIQSMDFQFFFNTAEFTYDTVFNNASLSSLLVNVAPEFNQGGALELRLTSFTFPGLYPNQTTLLTLRFTTNSVNPCNLNIVTNQNSVIQLGDNAFNAGPCTFVVLGCSNPPAFAGDDQQICGDETTLTGNQPLQGTGTWSVVSGTGVFQDPNGTSTLVTGLSPGFNSFKYTLNNNPGDPENSDTVLVFSYETPSPAVAGANQTVCDAIAGLSAESPTIGTGTWSAPGSSLSFADETAAQTLVFELIQGDNQVVWTVSNGVCPPSLDTLIILRTDTVYAGPDQILCESSAFLQAAEPISGTGFWTVLSGNGTFEDANQSNTAVSDLGPGENIFQWTATGLDCIDSTDIVIITRLNLPSPALAEADFATCTNTTQISATVPAIGTGQWSSSNAGLSFDDSTSAQTQVSGLLPGFNELIWTVSNGSCPSNSDTLLVTLSDTVSAGIDQVVCDSAATLNASNPLSGSGLWTVLSGSGEFADATSPTSTVSGLSAGENIFQWTVSGFSCPDSIDQVSIIVSCSFNVFAGDDTEICETFYTLQGSELPEGGSGLWTVLAGSGTFADASSPNSGVSGMPIGTNTFIWTVTLLGTSISDTVNITVSEPPTVALAGDDQSVCSNKVTLAANTPLVGQGVWTTLSGNGTFVDSSDPATTFVASEYGTDTLIWTISTGVCRSSDTVLITTTEPPFINLPNDTTICENQQPLVLAINFSQGAQLQWNVLSGAALVSSDQSTTPKLSGLPRGVTQIEVIATNGDCESRDTINITVNSADSPECRNNEIVVPTGFSPNGDGTADFFIIENLNGRNALLQVFNRWGQKVYEAESYQNDWNGSANKGIVLFGEQLPEGTYYYQLNIEGEAETRKDFITLWR